MLLYAYHLWLYAKALSVHIKAPYPPFTGFLKKFSKKDLIFIQKWYIILIEQTDYYFTSVSQLLPINSIALIIL